MAHSTEKESRITRIYLVRHGATDYNVTKRAQGQADIPLNPEGRRQAREVARRLAPVHVDSVYSSDLGRSVATAEAIAERRGLSVIRDPAFREIDQGEWTGLSVDEIRRRWPERWGKARHHSARPGGESPADVRRRALAGLRRAVQSHPDETVVVVSHGGTIRWIVAEAMAYDDEESARVRGLSNGGAVVIDAQLAGDRLELELVERLDGAAPDLDDPNH
jgi:broad specificity phosphatase PhoE